jgi:hypothetical protein
VANPKSVHPKTKCDKCDGMFSVAYMSQHRRKMHGIYGGVSGRPKMGRPGPVVVSVPKQTVVRTIATNEKVVRVLPIIIVEDEKGKRYMMEAIDDA